MSSTIITLLTLAISLLSSVQANPAAAPAMRQQAYSLASQVLTIAAAQQGEVISVPKTTTKNPMSAPEEAAGAAAPEANTPEVSLTSHVEHIQATGFANQVIATLAVKNTGEDKLTIGGTYIASQLGVSLEGTDSPVSFLYKGGAPKFAQYDLSSKDVELDPGETVAVEVRITNQPGATGTLTLTVAGAPTQVQVVE